jgi:hypothetical protein
MIPLTHDQTTYVKWCHSYLWAISSLLKGKIEVHEQSTKAHK